MNMIRVSHHDLPNPAKRITELEAELLRVRAALEDQHASTDALWNENTALRAALKEVRTESSKEWEARERYHSMMRDAQDERDALRARLARVTETLDAYRQNNMAYYARLQALEAAALETAESLERHSVLMDKHVQDRADEFDKWVSSKKGRKPYDTGAMPLAAEVCKRAAEKLRAALADVAAAPDYPLETLCANCAYSFGMHNSLDRSCFGRAATKFAPVAAASTRSLAGVPDAGGAVVDAALEMAKDWTVFHAAFLHMRDEYGDRNLPETQQRIDKAFERLEKFIDALAAQRAAPLPDAAYVWAGANPFTGEQVLDLLNENERLRKLRAAPPPAPAAENGETK